MQFKANTTYTSTNSTRTIIRTRWYFNAIAFAEQSEIGEFDQQYLINYCIKRILSTCIMLSKCNQ